MSSLKGKWIVLDGNGKLPYRETSVTGIEGLPMSSLHRSVAPVHTKLIASRLIQERICPHGS